MQKQNQDPQVHANQSVTSPSQAVPPLMVTHNPGEGMGIAGFIFSLLGGGLLSLILALVSKSQSNKAGLPMTGLAKAGLIISIIQVALVALGVIAIVIMGVLSGYNDAANQ